METEESGDKSRHSQFHDQHTLAGSYSEGATMSQSIILAHKGENLV